MWPAESTEQVASGSHLNIEAKCLRLACRRSL